MNFFQEARFHFVVESGDGDKGTQRCCLVKASEGISCGFYPTPR